MRQTPTILSLAIGLGVVSLIFFLIERIRPALPSQRRRAADTRTDLVYLSPSARSTCRLAGSRSISASSATTCRTASGAS